MSEMKTLAKSAEKAAYLTTKELNQMRCTASAHLYLRSLNINSSLKSASQQFDLMGNLHENAPYWIHSTKSSSTKNIRNILQKYFDGNRSLRFPVFVIIAAPMRTIFVSEMNHHHYFPIYNTHRLSFPHY